MRDTCAPLDEAGSLADARRIDAVCDAFEAAWQQGGRPSLETYLADLSADLRSAALRQLLALEVDYRRRAGETLRSEDYLPRFAADAEVVEEVFVPSPPTPLPRREGRDTPMAIPGYEILGELGSGGMGIVYRARQVKAGRLVALKMILGHASPERRARFRTEVEAVARLQHPNIVQVYEVGEHHGQPFFSLEYCSGGSLDHKLAGTLLAPRQAALLLEQLARAVQAAHAQGVVHRDLKPANILLVSGGVVSGEWSNTGPPLTTHHSPLTTHHSPLTTYLPKITDFGLARKLDDAPRTLSGELIGTPSYMAPEQASGKVKDLGPACDIYALGAILYECLTGRPPFKAATPLDTLRLVCSEEPVAPRSLNPPVPRDLETICLKCLEKTPQQRYAGAGALADDLHRFLADEAIHARTPSVAQRGARWLRRHPVATSVLLATALLLATGVLGGLWHWGELADRLETEQQLRRAAVEQQERLRASQERAAQLAYASDTRLAHQRLAEGDLFHLAELLDRHLPGNTGTDQRDFAWYYARQFSRPPSPPALVVGRQHPVGPVYFSADGRLLMSSGDIGHNAVVKLWDTAMGLCRYSSPCAEGERWRSVWSIPLAALSGDGRTLAFVLPKSRDVRIIDVATGHCKAVLPQARTPSMLALSADGATLATAADREVRMWDTRSLTQRGQPIVFDCTLGAMSVAPDLRTVAIATHEPPGELRVVELATGAVVSRMSLVNPIDLLSYSPSGKRVAAWRRDGTVQVFNMIPGAPFEWFLIPGCRRPLAFTPDDRRFAVAMDDAVVVWDLPDRSVHARLRWQAAIIESLAFAPDGQTLAVGTDNGLLHRVNAECPRTHDPLRADLRCIHERAMAVAHDGKTVAIPDADGAVKLYDVALGTIRSALPARRGPIADCVFSPDDCMLATTGPADTEVQLSDTVTGALRQTLRADSPLGPLAFAASGLLAAGSADPQRPTIWVWDATTAQLRGKLTPRDGSRVFDLAFSPDGTILAATNLTQRLILWDVPARGMISPLPREEYAMGAAVEAIAFAPTGRTLVFGATANLHRLEIPATGPARLVSSVPLAEDGAVINLAFAPDGQRIVVGTRRTSEFYQIHDHVHVCDGTGQRRVDLQALDAHRLAAVWLPDGRLLVQQRTSREAQIYDLGTGEAKTLTGQALWEVRSLAFTPDGKSLYVGASDAHRTIRARDKLPPILGGGWLQRDLQSRVDVWDCIRTWDMDRLRPAVPLPSKRCVAAPYLISLSDDGRYLAAGGDDGSIWLWDLPQARVVDRLFISAQAQRYAQKVEFWAGFVDGKPEYQQHSEAVQALSFSPDRRWLAAVGARGTVTTWDMDNRTARSPTGVDLTGAQWAAFTRDSVLAIACQGQVRLWDPKRGTVRATLGAAADPPTVSGAFSPDGKLFAAGTVGQTIRVWDLRTGIEVRTFTGHMNQVAAVAFSPDGKTLASGDWSGAIKLWSLASLQQVGTLRGHDHRVTCLAFSPAGDILASGADLGEGAGEVFLWRAPPSELVPTPARGAGILAQPADFLSRPILSSWRRDYPLVLSSWRRDYPLDFPMQ